jgi:hypothetical protein
MYTWVPAVPWKVTILESGKMPFGPDDPVTVIENAVGGEEGDPGKTIGSHVSMIGYPMTP